jgi:glycine oxidase
LIRGEAQLRNPRHLKALQDACKLTGVVISTGVETREFLVEGDRLVALETSAGRLAAGAVCFTAGAWTGMLLRRLGVSLGVVPVRGQMVLYRCERPPISIVNEGSHI